MSTHSGFIDIMERTLKRCDADLDALVLESRKTGIAARPALERRIRELRARREAAHMMFSEVRRAAESGELQVRVAMQEAWLSMKKAIEKASGDVQ